MNILKYFLSILFCTVLLSASEITSYVTRAIVSHDDKMMVITSYAENKHSISLWNIDNIAFKKVKQYDFDDDTYFSENLVFSHDNKYLTVGIANHTYIWDTKSHKLIQKIPNKNEVSAVKFSHNDAYLIIAGQKNNVYVYDVRNDFRFYKKIAGKEKPLKSMYGTMIYDLSFSINDKYLLVSYAKRNAEIYDVSKDFRKIKTFDNKKDYISGAHFTLDEQYLITSRNANEMEVFSPIPPFKKLRTVEKQDEEDIYITTVSKGSQYYLSSWDYLGRIKVWDIKNGFKNIVTLPGHKEYTTELQFFDNDKYFVSAGGDNKIKIWETQSWKQVSELFLTEKDGFKYRSIK